MLCTKTVTLKSGETLINPNKFRSASSASEDTNRNVENTEQINWTKATEDWERVNGFFLSTSETVGETSAIFFYGKEQLEVNSTDGGTQKFIRDDLIAEPVEKTVELDFSGGDMVVTPDDGQVFSSVHAAIYLRRRNRP